MRKITLTISVNDATVYSTSYDSFKIRPMDVIKDMTSVRITTEVSKS